MNADVESKPTTRRYSPEQRERAVRMVLEHQGDHDSQWATICSIAEKIGCSPETLRKWVRQAEIDHGDRAGLSAGERERMKDLEREHILATLREVNTHLRAIERILAREARRKTLRPDADQFCSLTLALLPLRDRETDAAT